MFGRPALSISVPCSLCLIVHASAATANVVNHHPDDDTVISVSDVFDAIEGAIEAGKIAKDLWERYNSEHPVAVWEANQVALWIRDIDIEDSRVSNNFDKTPADSGVRVYRYRWLEGTVTDSDRKSAKVTFLADKDKNIDRVRSVLARDGREAHAVLAGELFTLSTPTDEDRNYYIGRLEANGGEAGFSARNPKAQLILEIVPEDELARRRGVVICEHAHYRGAGIWLSRGTEISSLRGGLGNWNDRVSSLRVFGTRIAVTLHDDDGFGGEQLSFRSDTDVLDKNGWNDRASSLKVHLWPP